MFNAVEVVFYNKEFSMMKDYIDRIQNTLLDDNKYIENINMICKDLLPLYYNLFYMGGLIEIGNNELLLKRILKYFFKKKSFKVEHLVNNLRCESHRWCICRALKNQYNIK